MGVPPTSREMRRTSAEWLPGDARALARTGQVKRSYLLRNICSRPPTQDGIDSGVSDKTVPRVTEEEIETRLRADTASKSPQRRPDDLDGIA